MNWKLCVEFLHIAAFAAGILPETRDVLMGPVAAGPPPVPAPVVRVEPDGVRGRGVAPRESGPPEERR
jgi:hypothetical protein